MKWLVILAVIGGGIYVGVAYVMESAGFAGLPGQVATGAAATVWDAVAQGKSGTFDMPLDEVRNAVHFNPKFRMLSFTGNAEAVPGSTADEMLRSGRDVHRRLWPMPLQDGEVEVYFHVKADFSVESTCIPFLRRQRAFRTEAITSCPRTVRLASPQTTGRALTPR